MAWVESAMMTRVVVVNRMHCVPPLRSCHGGCVCWGVSVYLEVHHLGIQRPGLCDGTLGHLAGLRFAYQRWCGHRVHRCWSTVGSWANDNTHMEGSSWSVALGNLSLLNHSTQRCVVVWNYTHLLINKLGKWAEWAWVWPALISVSACIASPVFFFDLPISSL